MVANKEESFDEKDRRPYTMYTHTNISHVHHFYFSEAVVDPANYVDIIHKLQTATEEDTFVFHLNTVGGNLSTGIQIVNAIRASRGHVIASVEAEAHSLGTILFLAADEYIVHDNCMMMFHNYSGGTFGKGNEQRAQLEATIEWYTRLIEDLYIPFLNREEFDRIIRGEDIWMHSDEIRDRLINMVEILEQERQERLRLEEEADQVEEVTAAKPTKPKSRPRRKKEAEAA